jgi:hypothetical protein
MFEGIGDITVKTTQLGDLSPEQQRLVELGLLSFTYGSEADTKRSQRFTKGKLRNASSAQGLITDTLTLRFNEIDWVNLGFSINAFPKTAGSALKIPVLKYATVPAATTFEIDDAAITAANDDYIFAYITKQGAWGQPGPLARAATPASPAARQVGVDTTGNKLVFNSAQASAPIAYTVAEDLTTVEYYGGDGTSVKYGIFEFWGRLYLPTSPGQWMVHFPEVTIDGRPTWNLDNDVPTIEVACSAATPSGWEEPFKLYNLDTAT